MTSIARPGTTGPLWPKLAAAFFAGVLFSAFSITQVARDGSGTALTAGAPSEAAFAEEGATYTDAEGNVLSADEVFVNEQGQLVDKQGRVVSKSGTAGSVAAGTAGKAGTAGAKAGTSGGGSRVGGGTAGGAGSSANGGGVECKAGKNGGSNNQPGITGTEIKLASTVVKDKEGASLLRDSETAMRAVINKVNNAGGICGRRISLRTDNDSWDAQRGQEYIDRYIREGYFALPVVPSSEGLSAAINSKLISNAGIPVVGTNGLRIDQYGDQWVWPVGSPTVSIMRVMAKHALAQGNTKFGIVWDNKYKFGLEGAEAFKKYVRANGGTIVADRPLDPSSGQYGTDANKFNQDCSNGGGCEVVVLLLVPDTALQWKSANQGTSAGRGTKKTYGAQTLFTDDFAGKCGGWCNGMVMWTGYNPPIAPLDGKPGVNEYVNDVRALNPGIDTRNQFTEGAYLGMKVFVDILKQCSPALTRACVQQKMDSLTYPSDLASQLTWKPGTAFTSRAANRSAQAFAIEAAGGSFNNWQYLQTGFISDPAPGS